MSNALYLNVHALCCLHSTVAKEEEWFSKCLPGVLFALEGRTICAIISSVDGTPPVGRMFADCTMISQSKWPSKSWQPSHNGRSIKPARLCRDNCSALLRLPMPHCGRGRPVPDGPGLLGIPYLGPGPTIGGQPRGNACEITLLRPLHSPSKPTWKSDGCYSGGRRGCNDRKCIDTAPFWPIGHIRVTVCVGVSNRCVPRRRL